MQKPKYSPAEEEDLMAQLWSPRIADDPEAFVLFLFPWGQPGTPLEKFRGPRVWQRDVLRSMAAHIREGRTREAIGIATEVLQDSTVSGRGIGKSALVAWLILWMLTTRIGSTVIVSANTENQLRTITWGELAKWVTLAINAHWWEISATKLTPATWLTELVERDLQKGTRYWAAEGKLWSEENPDGYAGAHNMAGMMVIFDESSGIPDSIWSVAAGFFTENILDRYWFAFSNGRRNEGYFYETHHSKSAYWRSRTVDARSVEAADVAYYEKIIDEYGDDSNEARIEVYGQFPKTGDDQFISPEVVDQAMQRAPWKDPTAPLILGVDPARGGTDSTVIAVRKGRDLLALLRYRGEDTMTIVGRVIDAIEEYRPQLTVIDEGGLGYGILDRLKEQNYNVRGVNFGWKTSRPMMWGNKRAEMWGAVRQWLTTASIPKDRKLKSDLISIKKKPDSTGRIFLLGKKEMKALGFPSPDDGDALAVTFAFPVASESVQVDTRIHRDYAEPAGTTSWMGA